MTAGIAGQIGEDLEDVGNTNVRFDFSGARQRKHAEACATVGVRVVDGFKHRLTVLLVDGALML